MKAIQKVCIRFLALLLLLWSSPLWALAAEPQEQVRQTVDEILRILNDQRLARPEMREEKQERIMEQVRSRFNFREMSKLTLTRHWRELTPAEQDRFVELFSQLLKNTYIQRVESYSQKEVRVSYKGQSIQEGRAVVSTNVATDSIETPINYRLKQEDEEWMVYDVVIEGVSLIRNYRSQFTRIIEKEKFAGLVQRMEDKIKTGEPS